MELTDTQITKKIPHEARFTSLSVTAHWYVVQNYCLSTKNVTSVGISELRACEPSGTCRASTDGSRTEVNSNIMNTLTVVV